MLSTCHTRSHVMQARRSLASVRHQRALAAPQSHGHSHAVNVSATSQADRCTPQQNGRKCYPACL